jgi:hypothetical protein
MMLDTTRRSFALWCIFVDQHRKHCQVQSRNKIALKELFATAQ